MLAQAEGGPFSCDASGLMRRDLGDKGSLALVLRTRTLLGPQRAKTAVARSVVVAPD
jgi:hypothetical protein